MKFFASIKSCPDSFIVMSSKEGIRLFEKWEEANKIKAFKKVELPDSYNGFIYDEKIYFVPSSSENKGIRIIYKKKSWVVALYGL